MPPSRLQSARAGLQAPRWTDSSTARRAARVGAQPPSCSGVSDLAASSDLRARSWRGCQLFVPCRSGSRCRLCRLWPSSPGRGLSVASVGLGARSKALRPCPPAFLEPGLWASPLPPPHRPPVLTSRPDWLPAGTPADPGGEGCPARGPSVTLNKASCLWWPGTVREGTGWGPVTLLACGLLWPILRKLLSMAILVARCQDRELPLRGKDEGTLAWEAVPTGGGRGPSSGGAVMLCPPSRAESDTWPEAGCQAPLVTQTKEPQASQGPPGGLPSRPCLPRHRQRLPVAASPPWGPQGSQFSCRNARPWFFWDKCPRPSVPWWQLWLGPGPWGSGAK